MAEKTKRGPVLVAVDFSPHSEGALAHASELAVCMNAPLVILHVVHDPGDAPGYYRAKGVKKQLRRLEDVAGDMMEEFLAKMAKEDPYGKLIEKAERMLIKGLPVPRILQVVEKLQPCLVVLGSQGRTGLKHLMLGSKAEQVVRLCPVPVTIVKATKS